MKAEGRTETHVLVKALHELARTIISDDGVANAAITEAADRLSELDGERSVLLGLLASCAAVILTIEGENDDESDALNDLLNKIDMAIHTHSHYGRLI